MADFKVFDDNLHLLEKLFGKKEVLQKLNRLKFIYKNTEESWLRNLEYFENSEIRYILLCEAPPYSETLVPKYFYNDIDQKFNTIIWNTFFHNIKKPTDIELNYKNLAEKGFLLIDTIPFAMQYSTQKHRDKDSYFQLITNSLNWILEKLRNSKIKLSDDLKVAFGFKINAQKFIKATNGAIVLNEKHVKFDESNIGINKANYPDSKMLSNIYFSKNKNYKYYKGEIDNPYCKKGRFQLDLSNPKSLFWYYEKHFDESYDEHKDYKKYITNLINNKLSEYCPNTYVLWEMYFNNSK